MTLLAVGLNHRTAPVSVLEQAVLDQSQRVKVLHDLVAGTEVAEAAVLSTCNRVEVYVEAATFHGGVGEVCEVLSRATGLPFDALRGHLYVHHEARALQHLFAVACGLDSVVVGEAQVLGQLRAALREATEAGTVARALGDVLSNALRVGKRARTETGIDRAGNSVVSVAVDLAARALDGLTDRRVLIVGAGSTGALAGAVLRRAGAGSFVVANRTATRAAALAATLAGRGIGLDGLPTALVDADVVVSSTAATGIVLSADLVAAAVERRGARPLVVVDLALPRDVDPSVGELPGVTLVDLEAITASRAGAEVAAEAAAVAALVDAEVTEFLELQRASAVAPTVAALRAQAAEVVRDELERLDARSPGLDDRTRAELAHTVHRVVDKLLHLPTVRVKELARIPGGQTYAEALQELFDLPRDAAARLSAPDQGAP